MTKICTECGIEKDIGEFHLNSWRKDGHCSGCKKCVSAIRKKYYQTHKEQSAEYYHTHKKERVEWLVLYNHTHKKERAEWFVRYYHKHQKEINERCLRYYHTHKKEAKQYCKTHKKEIAERKARYYQDHKKEAKQYCKTHKKEAIEYGKKIRRELKNSYVKKLIVGNNKLKYKDIPSEMVDMYKTLVLIYREIKKIKRGETT